MDTKAALMLCAYIAAHARVMQTSREENPVDIYEEAKRAYTGCLLAHQDRTGVWADPPASADGAPLLGGLAGLLPKLLAMPGSTPLGTLADVVKLLANLGLGGAPTTPATPGAELK